MLYEYPELNNNMKLKRQKRYSITDSENFVLLSKLMFFESHKQYYFCFAPRREIVTIVKIF